VIHMESVESRPRSFVVITPAKDESQYIERTIASMLRQTARPKKWIIVDDGSRDSTLEIVKECARRCAWIVPVAVRRDAERKPGSAEIRAFYVGYDLMREDDYDFVVKLDADLELPSDYFERMLGEFDRDPLLGIASGVFDEMHDGVKCTVKMPEYHAAGASKIVRRQCLLDIGGFPLSPGWDTADEIKAQARGWRTRHFPQIHFMHLRPEGQAIGLLRTSSDHGKMYYAYGGGPVFLLFKAIRRMVFGKPLVLGGVALFFGYVNAAIRNQSRLVSKAEANLYRKLLNSQVSAHLTKLSPFRR